MIYTVPESRNESGHITTPEHVWDKILNKLSNNLTRQLHKHTHTYTHTHHITCEYLYTAMVQRIIAITVNITFILTTFSRWTGLSRFLRYYSSTVLEEKWHVIFYGPDTIHSSHPTNRVKALIVRLNLYKIIHTLTYLHTLNTICTFYRVCSLTTKILENRLVDFIFKSHI